MRTCGNCTFWERFSDDEGDLNFGECRRYPPNVPVHSKDPEVINFNSGKDSKTVYHTSIWNTQTELYDWCGEFMTTEELRFSKGK